MNEPLQRDDVLPVTQESVTVVPEVPRSNTRGLFEGSFVSFYLIGLSTVLYQFEWAYIVPGWRIKRMFARLAHKTDPVEYVGMPTPKTALALGLTGLYGFAALIGLVAAIAAFISACVSKDARQWIERKMGWLADRPLPAIHLIDVVAIFTVYLSLLPLVVMSLHAIFPLKVRDLIMPTQMLANDLAMIPAVGCAIAIARWRARGAHGSRGFWPPWSSDFVTPVRPIWKDILLGMACYPLLLWLAILVGLENKFLVNAPDQHFIIMELARHPRPAVAAIFMLTGTLGAAFFEETLFRGILYNAMRRFMGASSAALTASFLFAYVHGLKSDILGLFVLGLAMTWLYDKTGRLVAGMAFHFTNNMMSMILALALYNQ